MSSLFVKKKDIHGATADEDLVMVEASAPDFQVMWDAFVSDHGNLGPFYTRTRLEHCVCRAELSGGRNCSFLVRLRGACVGIVPLVLEETTKGRFFSSAGGFNTLYAPYISPSLGLRERKKVQDHVFEEIDRLAAVHDVKAACMTIDPHQSLTEDSYNWLCRYGYLDCTITTHIVDLAQNLEMLKARRRRRYKSLINKGLREFKFTVVDQAQYDRTVFDAYVAMHEKAAGRKTRSQTTFEKQDVALRKGEASLIAATYQGKFVHLTFFHHLNGYAYYSSSADDPDFALPGLPTGPAMMWYAIEHFKAAGFKCLETGWQPLGPQLFDPPSRKQLDIAFFKEGFGGRNTALFRGVKYYDKEFMREDLIARVQSLVEQWPPSDGR